MTSHEAQPRSTRRRPAPIDARAPRFNQGVLTVALLVGFVFELRWLYVVWGVVLLLSALGGSKYGPFLRLYRDVIKPRLGPPAEIEDPRPPRFAATVGTVFLAAATLALAADVPGVADALALVVAALAALAAVTGLCVGCEVYVWIKKRTASGWDDVAAGITPPAARGTT